jgi:hypothetical protein
MSDSFRKVIAARNYHDAVDTQSEVFNLPPAYKEGLQPIWQDSYQVKITAGMANVGGVSTELPVDYHLSGNDWVETSPDVGKHYYIYMDRMGIFHVDARIPVYSDRYFSYYHPDNEDWRRIGVLFLSGEGEATEADGFDITDNEKIIFCGNAEKQAPSVVVGTSTYVEAADYYCDGVEDEVELNAALRYVSEAFSGGTVTLTSGTLNVEAIPVLLRNGCIVEGSYTGSVIDVSHGYHGVKTLGLADGTYLGDQIQLKNFQITRTDTNNKNAIYLSEASEILVENIVIDDWTRYGLEVDNCENVIVRNVIAKNGTDRGIYLNDTQGIIEDCVVHTLTSTTGCLGIVAENTAGSTRAVSVVNCEVYNLATSSSDGVDLVGISVVGVATTSVPTVIQGNHVHDINAQKVDAEALGITTTGQRKNIQGNTVYGIVGWNKNNAGGAAIRLRSSGSNHPDDCAVLDNVIDKCSTGIVIADSDVDRTFLSGNKVADCGQIVNYGGCEATASPTIDGTAASVVQCSWARSTDQAYQGTYSYKFTHTGSSAKSYAYLQDGTATNDLHGLSVGVEYTLEMWVKLTTIPYAEFAISIADYQSSWAATAQATVSDTDWQKVSVSRTIRASATGISLYLGANVNTDTASGEIAYVDNIRLYPSAYQNDHNNCLADSGTGTLY